jgi:hypothetical protein
MTESTNLAAWAWVMLASGGLAVVYFIYRLVWLERYRVPSGAGTAGDLVRLKGRVVGPGRGAVYCVGEGGEEYLGRSFHLQLDRETCLVVPKGAVLETRAYRHARGKLRGIMVGDRVTLDGVPTTEHRGEGLYRQAGRVPAVEAIRIMGGSWPELRWLRTPMVLALLLSLLSLGKILMASNGPDPAHQRLARAAVEHQVYPTGVTFTFYRGNPSRTGEQPDPDGLGVLIGDQLGDAAVPPDHLTGPGPR